MSDTPETDAFFFRTDIDWDDEVEFARKLERERDEAREELHKASVEANALATSIQKAEYSDAKEFELLGSVAGVISQIDNMYAGVRQQRDEAREIIRMAKAKFCEEGSDGNIASEMFSILSGAK